MKKIILGALVIATATFAACNSSTNSHESHEGHDHGTAATPADSGHQHTSDDELAELKPTFTNVDPGVGAAMKELTTQYLGLKNSLADDNSAAAAGNGNSMATALAKVDKAAMTPEQKKLFADNEDDLREHAEHIGKNNGNIEHQREHFAQMSEDMYALVKAFGAGQTIYHDNCPMYDNNKGAIWLSETQDIRNPYFGHKMASCGAVKEVIK